MEVLGLGYGVHRKRERLTLTPQDPQFSRSLFVMTQRSPHLVKGGSQIRAVVVAVAVRESVTLFVVTGGAKVIVVRVTPAQEHALLYSLGPLQ